MWRALLVESVKEVDMTTTQEMRDQIERFGQAFDYDVTYLHSLLAASVPAFEAYLPVQGMSAHREQLPLDAHFVARVTTMQEEDCGPCAQLNLRMAVQAGVARSLLQTLIGAPEALPPLLHDVRAHAIAVVKGGPQSDARLARLRRAYGDAGIAELALCIAGSRIYPTLKRGMGTSTVCEKLTLDF